MTESGLWITTGQGQIGAIWLPTHPEFGCRTQLVWQYLDQRRKAASGHFAKARVPL